MHVTSRPAPNRPARQTCSSTPSAVTPLSRPGSATRSCARGFSASRRVCQWTLSRCARPLTVASSSGPRGQDCLWSGKDVGLGERHRRAGPLVAAPHALAHQRPPAAPRGVSQLLHPAVVQVRDHPALPARPHVHVGLHQQPKRPLVRGRLEHAHVDRPGVRAATGAGPAPLCGGHLDRGWTRRASWPRTAFFEANPDAVVKSLPPPFGRKSPSPGWSPATAFLRRASAATVNG